MTQRVIDQTPAQIESRWSGQSGDLQVTTRVVDGTLNYVQLINTTTDHPSGQSYVLGGNQGQWNVNENLFITRPAGEFTLGEIFNSPNNIWMAPEAEGSGDSD